MMHPRGNFELRPPTEVEVEAGRRLNLEAGEILCYGTTLKNLRQSLEWEAKGIGWGMLCMSILSDVQELLARGGGDPNTARKMLNVAKWVLAERVAQKDALGRLL